MKLFPVLSALVAIAAAPAIAMAAAPTVVIDFENNWDYGATVDNTYAGSGVTFTNVIGLSNDVANGFTYYSGAPSMLGTASAQLDGTFNTTAYMNVANGVDNSISFYFSSPTAITGAVKAYSGLNGTGDLLGTFNLVATGGTFTVDSSDPLNPTSYYNYDAWTLSTFNFSGTARSFDLTATAGVASFDNIAVATVPEPESMALMLTALGVMGVAAARRRG